MYNLETFILPFVILAPVIGAVLSILLSVISQLFISILKMSSQPFLKNISLYFSKPNGSFGAIICSIFTIVSFIGLLLTLNPLKTDFQLVSTILWIPGSTLALGIDGYGLIFVFLTTFVLPICYALVTENAKPYKELLIISIIGFGANLAFLSMDLILFFIGFEAALIPIFMWICLRGKDFRRSVAAASILIYTLAGSVAMYAGFIILINESGQTLIPAITQNAGIFGNDAKEASCWWLIFIALAVKLPMVPVHSWLLEAHVEAPTGGSIILAAILLKFGGFGFLRILIPIFPLYTLKMIPFLSVIATVSFFYASIIVLHEKDLKKIIAYSSIGHMNLALLGLITFTVAGIQSSVFYMLIHGFVSGGLFLLVGRIYDRFHSRELDYFGGIQTIMPMYSTIMFIFILINFAFPPSCAFIAEIGIFVALIQKFPTLMIFVLIGTIFGVAYCLWMYTRIFHGTRRTLLLENDVKQENKIYWDLDQTEILFFSALLFIILLFSIDPQPFFSIIYSPVEFTLTLI